MGRKNSRKGGVYLDCWHIPGGGINEREDLTTALIREIKEEVGIDISNYEIDLIDDTGKGESEKVLKETGEKVICQMQFNVYQVRINDKKAEEITLKLEDDLEECEWFKINQLDQIKLTPPSVELFKKLGYI